MNKIWLIEGKVTKTPYMIDSTQFIDRRIVFAQTENEACEKFEKFWSDKSEDYGTSYYASVTIANEAIY